MDIDLKRLTDKILEAASLDQTQHHVLFDLLIHSARFCFSKAFTPVQIETLCSVIAAVVIEDIRQWQRTATASFGQFQQLMLFQSSERIPKSRGVFSPVQAVLAVDFVLRTYYARYSLYKYTLAKVPNPEPLEQGNVTGVEAPRQPPPLAEAVLIEVLSYPAHDQ